ncbi:MAG: hypothetical protein ACJ75H_13430 [Thermoanaerobaculia bacterium]
MNREAVAADRKAAVRAAARGWRKAGVIDDAALAGIEQAYPDDRQRAGPVFRVLLFIFTLVAINGAFGFFALMIGVSDNAEHTLAFLGLIFGLALAFATDFQMFGLKRRQGGTEAATSFSAVSGLFAFTAWFFLEMMDLKEREALTVTLFVAVPLLAVAAWRWGYPLYAACAAASLLAGLAAMPYGRMLWIVAVLVAAPILVRLSESWSLPPAHRDSFRAALLVALGGFYLAVQIWSFEAGLIEEIGGRMERGMAVDNDVLFVLAGLATVLVPIGYLAYGIRMRRYSFLLMGLAVAVASAVTMRHYIHLGPLWVVLTVGGALVAGAALLVRRYLDSGPDHERGGFTAEPLFEDLQRRRVLEAGAAVVTFSPDARPTHEEPKFAGGGGEFGGGGSNSEF